MVQKAQHGAFSSPLIVVMVAFLSVIIFASAQPSFAASGKKKPAVVAKTSAVEHTEARIKQLQDALKITEQQQEPWNSLTTVMRENAKDMDTLAKERAENAKTMNAVERLKLHSQITEAQSTQLKKFIPPFEAFYSSLSDEQKQVTDTLFRTGKHGKKTLK